MLLLLMRVVVMTPGSSGSSGVLAGVLEAGSMVLLYMRIERYFWS